VGLRQSGPPPEAPAELPVPPVPPRIAEGATYENCLDTLAGDPVSAVAIAETWEARGGGAVHCRGLALVAAGQPAVGAALLEHLAERGSAPPMARASVLSQAVQARLMATDPDKAAADASLALDLSPSDTDLLIMRAMAQGMRNRFADAVDDAGQALLLDPGRADALVLRATMRRKLNQLELAREDVSRALALDPDDADALLERGILRQRTGDAAGARADWEHARGADPGGVTADLAEQNLLLLEAGPSR